MISFEGDGITLQCKNIPALRAHVQGMSDAISRWGDNFYDDEPYCGDDFQALYQKCVAGHIDNNAGTKTIHNTNSSSGTVYTVSEQDESDKDVFSIIAFNNKVDADFYVRARMVELSLGEIMSWVMNNEQLPYDAEADLQKIMDEYLDANFILPMSVWLEGFFTDWMFLRIDSPSVYGRAHVSCRK